MPRQLTITPTPFKSSPLAVPPSPFSPRLPLTPPYTSETTSQLHTSATTATASAQKPLDLSSTNLPPPAQPLHWLWQCHVCRRVYRLGLTRRCLDDGHYFCAGVTTVKRSRRTGAKVTRHKACASEFDYQGWRAWGEWRRALVRRRDSAVASTDEETDVVHPGERVVLQVPGSAGAGAWTSDLWAPLNIRKAAAPKKDCWNLCDYPSECRWGKQNIVTPAVATVPSTPLPPPPPVPLILGSSPEEEEPEMLDVPQDEFERMVLDAVAAELNNPAPVDANPALSMEDEMDTTQPTMDDLLDSVKRRKRRSDDPTPSPLASNPPAPVGEDVTMSEDGGEKAKRARDDMDIDVKGSSSFGRGAGWVAGLWTKTSREK